MEDREFDLGKERGRSSMCCSERKPEGLSRDVLIEMEELLSEGRLTIREIASRLKVGKSSVSFATKVANHQHIWDMVVDGKLKLRTAYKKVCSGETAPVKKEAQKVSGPVKVHKAIGPMNFRRSLAEVNSYIDSRGIARLKEGQKWKAKQK